MLGREHAQENALAKPSLLQREEFRTDLTMAVRHYLMAHRISSGGRSMKPIMTAALLSVALAACASVVAFGQATEDAIVKGGQFPLAAKAGEDSHAFDRAPAGAVNQGKFDMDKW